MELARNSNPVDKDTLKYGFTLLDPSLNDKKAIRLASEIMKNKGDRISIKDLVDILGCPPDDSHESSDWYHHQLLRIKRKLKVTTQLQEEFEVMN